MLRIFWYFIIVQYLTPWHIPLDILSYTWKQLIVKLNLILLSIYWWYIILTVYYANYTHYLL
jgi:hypothetical protein